MNTIAGNKRRVRTLYRVSTKKQVNQEKNDLPEQRKACRDYIASNEDWVLTYEYMEKGVSGFKKSAEERNEIQKIKTDAENGEFDILVLFHSDRLGRQGDDTYDLAKYLMKIGIEIWTVYEDRIKNDELSDKICNLIRFDNAKKESEKISFRVSTVKRQLALQGIYTGGPVPYGYKKVKNGRVDKRGRDIHDLEVDLLESLVIEEIFDWYVKKGWGTGKIANALNDRGIKTHNNAKFQSNTINRILSNTLLIGHIKNKDELSIHLPDLQIISKDLYDKAQFIKQQRSDKRTSESRCAMRSGNETLLSGNVFCGHCGSRVNSFKKDGKYTRKDGETVSYGYTSYYNCSNSWRNKGCEGQSAYLASKIDDIVIKVLNCMFKGIRITPKEIILEKRFNERLLNLKNEHAEAKLKVEKKKGELEILKKEILSVIIGESALNREDVQELIDQKKAEIEEYEKLLKNAENSQKNAQVIIDSIEPKYNELIDWSKEFNFMDIDAKRVVANRLISKVIIKRNYQIEIELNMDYQQFCSNWDITELQASS